MLMARGRGPRWRPGTSKNRGSIAVCLEGRGTRKREGKSGNEGESLDVDNARQNMGSALRWAVGKERRGAREGKEKDLVPKS
jgi:hypothetical protein